ncbi:hypothetical protein F2S74_13495, partial [Pseudomonas syringae pv. actinidiae]|nr:hypothetical protein [Pseudomonas syringae pv. actinidiae]
RSARFRLSDRRCCRNWWSGCFRSSASRAFEDRAKGAVGRTQPAHVVFRWGRRLGGVAGVGALQRIIVTAVATDVPQALLDQLAPGGRLVIPVGAGEVQQLMLIIREENGFSRHVLGAVRFVPLLNGPIA